MCGPPQQTFHLKRIRPLAELDGYPLHFGHFFNGPAAAFPAHTGVLHAAEGRCGFVGVKDRSEEHTSELQSQSNLVCRLLLEKKKKQKHDTTILARNTRIETQAS